MVFAMNQKGKVDHLGEELYTELYDISNVNKAREIVQTSNDFFCTMVKTCDHYRTYISNSVSIYCTFV